MSIESIERLAIQIRKGLPRRLRHFLRLAKHALTEAQSSASIPSELLVDCRMCASRSELVGLLPHNGRVAEVGTQSGEFAVHILSASTPSELHLIDLDLSEVNAALSQDARIVMHQG